MDSRSSTKTKKQAVVASDASNKSHTSTTSPYHGELHVAVVSPPGPPTVANDPVAFWYIDAHDIHSVIDVVVDTAATEDATLVWAPLIGVDCYR